MDIGLTAVPPRQEPGERRSQLRPEEADRFLDAATSTDDAFFAHWHESPVARLAGYYGNCAQLLGRTAEATIIIEDALAALSPSLMTLAAP